MVQFTTLLATCASVLFVTLPVLGQSAPPAFNSTGLPPSCSTCAKVATDIGTCTDLPCYCSDSIATEFYSCFQCAVDAGSKATGINTAEANKELGDYITACKSLGNTPNISATVTPSSGSVGASSGAISAGLSLGLLGAVTGLAMGGFLV